MAAERQRVPRHRRSDGFVTRFLIGGDCEVERPGGDCGQGLPVEKSRSASQR